MPQVQVHNINMIWRQPLCQQSKGHTCPIYESPTNCNLSPLYAVYPQPMTTNSESKNGLTEGNKLSKITKTWHKTYQIATTATFTVCSVSKMHDNKLWTEKYFFEKVHKSPKSPNLSNSSYCKYFGSKKRGGKKVKIFIHTLLFWAGLLSPIVIGHTVLGSLISMPSSTDGGPNIILPGWPAEYSASPETKKITRNFAAISQFLKRLFPMWLLAFKKHLISKFYQPLSFIHSFNLISQ